MEGITNSDYKHPKWVWEDVEIKILGEYYDLHVQSNTLLLADILESFYNRFIEIYEFDRNLFLSTQGFGMPRMVRTITGIVSKRRYGANVR